MVPAFGEEMELGNLSKSKSGKAGRTLRPPSTIWILPALASSIISIGSSTKSIPARAARDLRDPEALRRTSTTARAFPSCDIAAARLISETSP